MTSTIWKSPLDPLRGKSWRGLGNYRVVAALLLATMIGLYWQFRGDQNYYPVSGRVTDARGQPVGGLELVFAGESPRFTFTQRTDAEGRFAYGTKAMAGGAPAGTYRVKIAPADTASRPIPEHYGDFDRSGLQFHCQPRQNHLEIQLTEKISD